MSQSNPSHQNAFHFDNATIQQQLEEFEQKLQTIQTQIKPGKTSQSINQGTISAFMTDVENTRDHLEKIKEFVNPKALATEIEKGKKIVNPIVLPMSKVLKEAIDNLNDAINELIMAVDNRQENDRLKKIISKESAEARDTNNKQFLGHLTECRRQLSTAEGKLPLLRSLLATYQTTDIGKE